MAQTVQIGKIGLPIKYNTLPTATSNLTGVIGIANNKYYKCNGTSWEEIVSPSGTLEIISNGEKDVTNYAKANVNIPNQNPYIVATPDLMPNYLTSAYEDNYVKYVGTTDENYEKNAVYQVYQYTQGNFSFRKVIWTGDADAVASNVLNGKTFYSNSTTKLTGTMYNVGQDIGTINNTEHPRYNIAEGYHNGTGYVQINPSEIIDCVAANILQGKRVLGVIGTLVKGITPTGKKTITSTAETDVTNFATAQVVDSNLVASNIKKNVSILGVTGTLEEGITPTGTLDITTNGTKDVTNYASVNVNVPLPTLNAPTISLSNSTVTITNPVTNGSFVSGYDVYKNGTLLTSITLATVDLSTLITESGTYTITVKAYGTNFNESVASNSVSYVVQSVSYTVSVNLEPYAHSISVYDGQNDSTGIILGSVSGGETKSFNITSGYLYILGSGGSTGSHNTGVLSGGVSLIEDGNIYALYRISGDGSITGFNYTPCFVKGTLITMANGTQKPVENIEYGDEVLCYDFEKGEQTTSYIDWMIPKQTATEYWKITLSDGTELKLVGSNGKSHRLYNVTKQSFMYPQDFEKDDLTLKENGDLVKVVSCEKIFETVSFYNISSKDHINVYAEGVLTSNRLSNRFEIKDNKYTDKQIMTDEEIKAYKKHLERLKK